MSFFPYQDRTGWNTEDVNRLKHLVEPSCDHPLSKTVDLGRFSGKRFKTHVAVGHQVIY